MPLTKTDKARGEADLAVETEFSLNMLRLRYLWDSQAETIRKLLDPEVWILEERSELEMLTLGFVRNALSNGPGVAMRRYLASI